MNNYEEYLKVLSQLNQGFRTINYLGNIAFTVTLILGILAWRQGRKDSVQRKAELLKWAAN